MWLKMKGYISYIHHNVKGPIYTKLIVTQAQKSVQNYSELSNNTDLQSREIYIWIDICKSHAIPGQKEPFYSQKVCEKEKKNLLFSSLICNSAKFSSGFSISLKAKGLNALGNLCFIHFLANRSFACKMKYGSFRNSLQFELIGTILKFFCANSHFSYAKKKMGKNRAIAGF